MSDEKITRGSVTDISPDATFNEFITKALRRMVDTETDDISFSVLSSNGERVTFTLSLTLVEHDVPLPYAAK